LRSYQTEPQIWAGTDECQHVWGAEQPKPGSEYREGLSTSIFAGREDKGEIRGRLVGNAPSTSSTLVGGGKHRPGSKYAANEAYASGGSFCQLCGAWRGELGSEPTIELFISHLVEVFREVWRVLRSDGVAWVNMGDTMATGKGTCKNPGGGPGSIVQDKKDAGAYQLDRHNVSDLKRQGLKPKDLCMIPARLALALQADGWFVRMDCIWHKCLSGGTVVWAKTQKGVMPSTIKDLARLKPETVQLWNGEKWTRVVSWGKTPRPEHPLEIELRSGQRIGCTAEHRWPTRSGLRRADELVAGDVIRTTTLPDTETLGASGLPQSVARVIGWYLAEGSKSGETLQFSLHADERWIGASLHRFAEFYGCSHHEHQYGNSLHVCLEGKMLNAVIDTYVASEGSHLKHLTNAAWQRDNNFLGDVLRGYLEGDGSHRPDTDEWRIGFCNNDALASDLRTICARIGWSIRLKRTKHTCTTNGKSFPGYRGRIRYAGLKSNDGEVVAIRPSRARFFYDIQVEDEPHLFALASGVLTHNSNPMPESVNGWRWERHRIKVKDNNKELAARYATVDDHGKAALGNLKHMVPVEWIDCPGCPKCTPNNGLVLRRGSWRPTKSHEYIFQLTKSGCYYSDAEAVKEEGTIPAGTLAAKGSAERSSENGVNSRPPEYKVYSGTRNLRSVFSLASEPSRLAHYAAFPKRIPEIAIKSSTSEKGVCPTCGAPWARVVERTQYQPDLVAVGVRNVDDSRGDRTRKLSGKAYNDQASSKTTGWRPTCSCPATDPVPATVLDPFMGVGTTGVVAVALGRSVIGIELNPKYAGWARERITKTAPLFLETSDGNMEV